MTAAQCRAARALLGWTQTELAEQSGVGVVALGNFERGRTALMPANLAALRAALGRAGVLLADDGSSGVAFRERAK